MFSYRQQALIDAPVAKVWELVGNPNRHPEWFPKIAEVECEGIEKGCTFRQVTRKPWGGEHETTLRIDELDDGHEVFIRCLDTGTFSRFVLTEAQGGTFVDFEFGQDPMSAGDRLLEHLGAKRYFRRWGEQAIDELRRASEAASAAPVS